MTGDFEASHNRSRSLEKMPTALELELREKMRDPSYLPTTKDVLDAFCRGNAGENKKAFEDFCNNEDGYVYELLNKEFITSLSNFFLERAKEFGATDSDPLTILEIGAGNGRLSHFIRENLGAEMSGKIKVVASDSGEWKIAPTFPVENLDHAQGIEKYHPQIVVFSWMPYGKDYTKDFRAAECVKEYILIGEPHGGCCGHPELTWGFEDIDWDDEENDTVNKVPFVPLYERDGFEWMTLDEISENQMCRSDTPPNFYHSSTVSFRRTK